MANIIRTGGGGGVNDTLPPQVSNLNVAGGDGKLTVSFDDTAEAYQQYLKDYVIVYKLGGIPTGVNDGIKVVVAK